MTAEKVNMPNWVWGVVFQASYAGSTQWLTANLYIC